METSMAIMPMQQQQSSPPAAIAAQLLEIDAQPLDEPLEVDWKKKYEQLNVKYERMKKLYRAERVAALIREMPKDKEKDVTTEELSNTKDLERKCEEKDRQLKKNEAQMRLLLVNIRRLREQVNQRKSAKENGVVSAVQTDSMGETAALKSKEKEAIANSKVGTLVMEGASLPDPVGEFPSSAQLSLALNAARLLGVDEHLLLPEDAVIKCAELEQALQKLQDDNRKKDIGYKRYRNWYLAEQKTTEELRKKLEYRKKVVKVEEGRGELVPDQFNGVHHHQPMDSDGIATSPPLAVNQLNSDEQPVEESNEAFSSPPVQTKHQQLSAQMRQRHLEHHQMDVAQLPPVEKEEDDGEEDGGMQVALAPVASQLRPTTTRRSVPAGSVFKCAQCPPDKVAFSSAQLLAQHHQRCHGDRQHWHHRCPECQRPCPSRTALEDHMRVHSGERPFKCRQCGRGFAQKGQLKVHARLHTGERPYTCPVCQKTFPHAGNLARHARLHSGETPYS